MCAKVRVGFVSNSSSSSFLIYGTSVDSSDLIEIAKKLFNKTEEEIEEEYNVEEDGEDELGYAISKKLPVEYISGSDCGGNYLGRSWSSVGDEETGKQFKESIETSIKEHLPNAKFTTHEEAWYD